MQVEHTRVIYIVSFHLSLFNSALGLSHKCSECVNWQRKCVVAQLQDDAGASTYEKLTLGKGTEVELKRQIISGLCNAEISTDWHEFRLPLTRYLPCAVVY